MRKEMIVRLMMKPFVNPHAFRQLCLQRLGIAKLG